MNAKQLFITLPLTVWGQVVFAVQESGDARLIALIDQAVAAAVFVSGQEEPK